MQERRRRVSAVIKTTTIRARSQDIRTFRPPVRTATRPRLGLPPPAAPIRRARFPSKADRTRRTVTIAFPVTTRTSAPPSMAKTPIAWAVTMGSTREREWIQSTTKSAAIRQATHLPTSVWNAMPTVSTVTTRLRRTSSPARYRCFEAGRSARCPRSERPRCHFRSTAHPRRQCEAGLGLRGSLRLECP